MMMNRKSHFLNRKNVSYFVLYGSPVKILQYARTVRARAAKYTLTLRFAADDENELSDVPVRRCSISVFFFFVSWQLK